MADSSAFAARLKELRLERGMSQSALAGETLTSGYISLLEHGHRQPSAEVVEYLAARLGCSTTRLLTGQQSDRDHRIALEQAYARLAIEHGEYVEARSRLERLLTEDRIPVRDRDEASLLLGRACERAGDLRSAVEALEPLMERALVQDTHLEVAFLAITLMRCYLDSGDAHQAVRIGQEALTVIEAQQLGGTDDYFRLAATVMDAYMSLGDWLKAETWASRYLALAGDHPSGQAALLWNRAILAEHEGRLDQAVRLCDRALGLLGEQGTLRDTPRLQLDTAWMLLLINPPHKARVRELLERCAGTLADLGSRADRARYHWLYAILLIHEGDVVGAESRAREALGLIESGAPAEQAQAHVTLSDALVAQGRRTEATESLVAASTALASGRGGRTEALGWRDIAERFVALGELSKAETAFRRALDGAGVYARCTAILSRVSDDLSVSTPATVHDQ